MSMSPISTSPGTFFYLCALFDGCSRVIVHWELRETMTEADVEIIL
jgi:putative transposase